MPEKTTRFDVADYLKTDTAIQVFLNEVAQTGDAADFLHALNVASRAKGMTAVALQSGVTRASLYKSLADGGNPRFDTVFKVCQALGVKLVAQPVHLV